MTENAINYEYRSGVLLSIIVAMIFYIIYMPSVKVADKIDNCNKLHK